ncbi:conjugal transfer protein TraH [Sinimarinibacterium sp. NLF-5-8]|uniref:conjugal transfer protein TraH n=1 Tax=Sinimarinibacterium sp. NLF-5-8 TaxID=2698684 RepID=UPI00137BB97C|nr:conjugal transfer protein TraH [Sinimarinibacterium sp. NLF-5-8]QHS08990.1 hypothetical protein GT972_01765 [Sinimarinibacterium sp. NLF-5-8]
MKKIPVFFRLFAFLLVAMAWSPTSHAANAMADAFSQLTSSAHGAGHMRTSARNVYFGGSLNVRFPVQRVRLVSITPPHFSAGCGGIDASLGSLSFIKGAEIKKLIDAILSNSVGLVIDIAMRVLCPICADVIARLREMAQLLSSISIDSCEVATALVEGAYNAAQSNFPALGLKPLNELKSTEFCRQTSTKSGAAADSGAASKMCTSINDATERVTKWIGHLNGLASGASPTPQNQVDLMKALEESIEMHSNKAWAALTKMGYASTSAKELMISMTGFQLPINKAAAGESPKIEMSDSKYQSWGPEGPSYLLALIMYGTDSTASMVTGGGSATPAPTAPPAQNQSTLDQQINEAVTSRIGEIDSQKLKDLPFIYCLPQDVEKQGAVGSRVEITPYGEFLPVGGTQLPTIAFCNADHSTIDTVGEVAIKGDNLFIQKEGLYTRTAKILTGAIKDIQGGRAISNEAVALMTAVPLPLYRMVNIAAVYPDTAAQLVDMYSGFVALVLARSILTSQVLVPKDSGSKMDISATESMANAMAAMQAVVGLIKTSIDKEVALIGQTAALQNSLLSTLMTVDAVIYQSLNGTGLQGNISFTQGLVNGALR